MWALRCWVREWASGLNKIEQRCRLNRPKGQQEQASESPGGPQLVRARLRSIEHASCRNPPSTEEAVRTQRASRHAPLLRGAESGAMALGGPQLVRRRPLYGLCARNNASPVTPHNRIAHARKLMMRWGCRRSDPKHMPETGGALHNTGRLSCMCVCVWRRLAKVSRLRALTKADLANN